MKPATVEIFHGSTKKNRYINYNCIGAIWQQLATTGDYNFQRIYCDFSNV